jgi:hypothetical protein
MVERCASAVGRQLRERQAVDKRHADFGPLQALVRRGSQADVRPKNAASKPLKRQTLQMMNGA